MIQTFRDKRTAAIFIGEQVRGVQPDLQQRARQWRVCFRWQGGDSFDVEFCDYH